MGIGTAHGLNRVGRDLSLFHPEPRQCPNFERMPTKLAFSAGGSDQNDKVREGRQQTQFIL
jgi:hypothetical protein